MFDILFTEMDTGPMAEMQKAMIFFFSKSNAFLNVYLLSQRTEAVRYIHNTTYHTASLLIFIINY